MDNELYKLIFEDIEEAVFDICIKYEDILNIQISEVDPAIEKTAAEALYGIICKARFEKINALLNEGGSYTDIVEAFPSLEGLTVGVMSTLFNGADYNYRIVEESAGRNCKIVFESINGNIEGRYEYNDFITRALQKIEAEESEDGEEGFFILTYYKKE